MNAYYISENFPKNLFIYENAQLVAIAKKIVCNPES